MTTRLSPFRLSDPAFAALGAGRPDAGTLATLRRAQLSRHLLLLREIRRAQRGSPAWYTRLTRADPGEARRQIADPMTGLWAAHTLRTGGTEGPRPGGHSLRSTHGDLTLTVRLDDTDPLRSRLGLAPTGPLSDTEVTHWQHCLDEAWRVLVVRHRAAASTMAAVLRVIVPVHPDPAAEGISSTSAEAFGAVAMSPPADPVALAVGLLHEVQHSVLNAVHQLFELVLPGGERGYSPWRDDPRPAFGILHGTYAYLSVTRFWRTEAAAGSRAGAFEFARWRTAVAESARALLPGGTLTAAGTRFVTALHEEVRPWLTDPVDSEVERLAGLAREDHVARWRLRNLEVTPADAAELARAWREGRPAPRVRSILGKALGRELENSPRARLAREMAKSGGANDPAAPPGGRVRAGDDALLRGDLGRARVAYQKCLDFGNDDAWSGLSLVSPHEALRRNPELVRAAALAIPEADVAALADWLSQ
ncbi:HEXXH motif-containing putative peptide modification protein [Actinoplanes sp. NPDC051861]|uniref:aKG-HExxH-type peptide beta-hydroxylase n=1 Tax=Actinoplanes sp. NPDC051861 TaxID=3155170 RepID=UPI003422E9B4